MRRFIMTFTYDSASGRGHAAGQRGPLAREDRISQMRNRLIRYKNAVRAKGLWK